jgi:hypothetical protein
MPAARCRVGDGPDGLPDGGRLTPLCRERVHVGGHRLRHDGEGNKALGRGPAGEGHRNLAQGTAMAIEDAMVLARALRAAG